jgi:hypothetical protein
VLSLQSIPSFDAQHTKQRCVSGQGFSLHAEVRCAMNQRKNLEQLCRYITHPAIAKERLKLNSTGDVVLRLKSPYQDAITHIVMSPLEFMQRLVHLRFIFSAAQGLKADSRLCRSVDRIWPIRVNQWLLANDRFESEPAVPARTDNERQHRIAMYNY